MDAQLAELSGAAQVGTITLSASPREAAERMTELGLGSLVVLDAEERPTGMLTDRDLTLRVVAREIDPESVRVGDVMSSPLISVEPDAGVDLLLQTMIQHGIRRVPLVQGGKLVGLLALDDLLQGLGKQLNDLGDQTESMLAHAQARHAVARIGSEIDEKLHDAYSRLQRTNWYAREFLLHQIDEFRDSLRRAIHPDESS
jgi:CBS domain-containing protein